MALVSERLGRLPRPPRRKRRAGRGARALLLSARAIPTLRLISQISMSLLSLWIGVRFYLFVSGLERNDPDVSLSLRSPGVEAYLPISGLIGLKHWVLTGRLNGVHPAATLFLLGAIGTGLLLKKGFCGWICPIGFASENLGTLGMRLLKRPRPLRVPPVLDYPLRSLKYLLLAFFLWAILVQMDIGELQAFIEGPYNRVADIKMLKFFTEMSSTTAKVLLALLALSLLVLNFWCRYLCPYGALLGALSRLSPAKVTRDEKGCINCGLCAKACPAALPVDKSFRVRSDECNGCLECVAACPIPRALDVRIGKRRRVHPFLFAALVMIVFFAFPFGGRLARRWEPDISLHEYRQHVQNLHLPIYQHNRGRPVAPAEQGGSASDYAEQQLLQRPR